MNETSLEIGEPHPMARDAMRYVVDNMTILDVEVMASSALSGNRAAEICLSTYERLQNGEAVSDRYVLGLAWFLLVMKNEHEKA